MKFFKTVLSLNPVSISFYLTLILFTLFFIGVPILDTIELETFDLRFISRGVEKPTPEVVLAVIDEKSLNVEGRWPWPREIIAKLVDSLSEDGAKVIGFDIMFVEPDQNTNLKFINQLDQQVRALRIKNKKLKQFIKKTKTRADNDLNFAESIKKSKANVVLGFFFHMSQIGLNFRIEQEEIDKQLDQIINSGYQLISYELQDIEHPFLPAYAPESNIEILGQAADSSGYFNMVPDLDGVVRRMPLAIQCGEEVFAPLSVRSLWHYLDQPQLMLKVASYGVEGIRMGDRFIPTDESGNVLINFLGPEKTFPHYSISDIIHGNLPKGTFKDKIVLVGATAIGIYDMRNTPFSPVYPGLEVHATVIDNILNSRSLSKPKWATIYDVLAILVLTFLTGIVLPRLSPVKGIVFSSVIFILHIMASQWLFNRFGLWVNIVYPLLSIVMVYTALTVYHYLVEEKNKRFLHATFTNYLSPELIDEMVNSGTMPELGGEARIITAYFTDIQGFSSFSEKLTAHQLVDLLNEYLTAMTDILIAEGGTLDKYEGDAIIAFLGAPAHIPDHAIRACSVAVSMQGALNELCEKWKNEKQLSAKPDTDILDVSAEERGLLDKWPAIVHRMKMRIGINTGEIVVGNMGSSVRKNYTMMGDSVNLAARLEEGAKQYGIYTAVSEYTMNTKYIDEKGAMKKVKDEVEARFIDNITVVGKSEPVKVYELCAMKGGLTDQEKELFSIFNRGMQHYCNMEWDKAITLFNESLKIERVPDGKTTPSEVFIRRCEMFKERPPVAPGEQWDGVYRLTEK